MNFRRIRQHEIENTREVGDAADDKCCTGHFLGGIASDRNATLNGESGQQNNSEKRAPREPALRRSDFLARV